MNEEKINEELNKVLERLNKMGIDTSDIFSNKTSVGDSIKEVDMGKWAIATLDKPILATWALSSCTGILAYDLDKQFAFLSHSEAMFSFSYKGDDKFGSPSISAHIQAMVREIEKGEDNYNLTFIVFPGQYPDKKMIETINNNINNIKSKKITVVSLTEKKPFISLESGGSITFDSRNGTMASYNPKDNPYHVYDDTIDKMYNAFGGKK